MRWLSLSSLAFLSLPVSLPIASAGRDYSRCVHACNEARRACDDRGAAECRASFPNSSAQRNACLSACHEIGVDQEQECKDRCQAIKRGESPEEP